MWRIILLLFVGSCYSSAEVYNVTVVELPKELPPGAPKLPASPAVPELPASPASPAVDSRIIGGVPAAIESYPFAVQVLYSNQLTCGGSLLTDRHVLSAAHCFADNRGIMYSASLFTVRVGTANLNSGGSTRRVSRIINHEVYNTMTREHDVAVVLLASSVTLSTRVRPASIPNQGGWVPDDAPVTVVGWGRTHPDINLASPILNQVMVYTVNTATCAARYRQLEINTNNPYPVTPNMLCTGILNVGGRDSCQGDSGGPVIWNGTVVVGVTSWGEGCGHPFYPGVNTRVASYTSWILNTVARNASAPSLGQTSVCLLLLSFLMSTVFQ